MCIRLPAKLASPLKLLGGTPASISKGFDRLQRRVLEFVNLFAPFVRRQWIFNMVHLPTVSKDWLSKKDAARFLTSCDNMNWPMYFQDFARGLTHFVMEQEELEMPYSKPYNRGLLPSVPRLAVWAAVASFIARWVWRRQARAAGRRGVTLGLWVGVNVCKLVSPVLQQLLALNRLRGQEAGKVSSEPDAVSPNTTPTSSVHTLTHPHTPWLHLRLTRSVTVCQVNKKNLDQYPYRGVSVEKLNTASNFGFLLW